MPRALHHPHPEHIHHHGHWHHRGRLEVEPLETMEQELPQYGGCCPHYDVKETASGFELRFDLPGLTREDIKIELDENRIIVSGERKIETAKPNERQLAQERHTGPFTRDFVFPTSISTDKVSAEYKDGVLTINVPKITPTHLKTIAIK